MLDTIRVSILEFTNDKISKENGWDTTKKGLIYDYKKVKLANKASIFMSYYSWSRSLVLHFSASKVQNGTNAIPYDFDRFGAVESIITKVVEDELGIKVSTKDMLVCRLDLNLDFVFKNEDRANAAMDFAEKILPARYERRFDYETGLTSQTRKGNGVRVYRKDKDKHLPKGLREEMDPTIRFEFQLNRKAVTRTFGYRPTLHQVLTNQVAVELAWNKLLDVYGLNKKIVTRNELHQFAVKNISQPSLRQTLKQINDEPSFTDKKQRNKQLAVTRKCKSLGICPYSCENPISEQENAYNEGRAPMYLPHQTNHMLRHTYCTRMIEKCCEPNSGLTIKLVQYLMGHEDAKTTLDIYTDVSEEFVHRTMSRFAGEIYLG